MKIVQYLGVTTVFALSMTTVVKAGGLAGGGGPPSRQALELMLDKAPDGIPALFRWDSGSLGLGVDKPLPPAMTLTAFAVYPDSSVRSARDLLRVAGRPQPVNAMNREGSTRSYRILDGVKDGTMLLIDRRLLMRASLHSSDSE